MCKYCEEDKRKKRDCIINTPIVSLRIIRNNGFNALAIKSYNLEKQVVDSYQTINYCPKCRKEARRVTKKEKQEHIEYIKLIVNKDIKFDKRKEELALGFIFNILTNNTVMNKYEYSRYGNIEKDETIRLVDCINYVGLKLGLKEDKQ